MGVNHLPPVDTTTPDDAQSLSLELVGRDRRVLAFGAPGSSLISTLADRGCSVVTIHADPARADAADTRQDVHLVDLDLEDPLSTLRGQEFDVALLGDVLEQVREPRRLLRSVRRVLAPGTGAVVLSVMNVAHVDMRLALLAGRFDYAPVGLLDQRHVRFFTPSSLERLIDEAGFVPTEVRRVTRPAFASEVDVERASVAPGALDPVLADPEGETYQLVMRAIPLDAFGVVAQLEARAVSLEREQKQVPPDPHASALRQAIDEFERVASEFDARTDAADRRTERAEGRIRAAEHGVSVALASESDAHDEARRLGEELEALQRTRVFRWSAGARRFYASVRRHRS